MLGWVIIVCLDLVVCLLYLGLGLVLGVLFTCLQSYEYVCYSVTLSSLVVGSLFYLITGFHGAHVILGVVFIASQCLRLSGLHINEDRCLGLEFRLLY